MVRSTASRGELGSDTRHAVRYPHPTRPRTMPTHPSPLGTTLHTALTDVRRRLGDPVAPIVVLTPSAANGVLARQQLALAADHIRVDFLTPERLLRDLARGPLAQAGRRPQPAAWVQATVGHVVRTHADAGTLGRFATTLTQPGWTAALARAVDTLEAAGLAATDLARLHLPDHRERLDLLALLLREVAARRAAEQLYAPSDLFDTAGRHATDGRWAGAVVMGDRFLGRRAHDALQAWLAAHPHAEVVVPPWHHLEPAPLGLLSAAHGPRHPVSGNHPAALRQLATHLFNGPPSHPVHADDSVAFVRTPDDVRELAEATREVLRAIDAGTPLDRIAVVLPDPDQVLVLRSHVERAGIPANWLVGPPLRSTPAAGFLLQLLELATGDDTVPTWYDLLRQPGLRLNFAAGAQLTKGRGRWRRILARSGAVRDTPTLCRAVQAWADDLDDDGFDPEGNRLAAGNLIRAIEAVHAAVAPLAHPATLGEHGRRWTELLQRWWASSPDHGQVLDLLRTWGPPGTGPELSLPQALGQLREALNEQAVAPKGSLTEPAVRVVTPMTLLGGAFDVVVVTGLTEGRLPRRPSEDAVLPDEVLTAMRTATGAHIPTSREAASFEARRFAAVVGACTRRLWLSSPATELLDERPLLPSSFLLDAATVQLGRRARYGDLADLQQRRGSRARPWPERPDDAIGRTEQRIAATAADPRAGLQRLAHHPTGRRLMTLHRALDRAERSPHTGLVPPELLDLPALRGEPLTPWALAELATNPGAFLVAQVLQVRRPQRLYGSSPELAAWWRELSLVRAIGTLLDAPRDERDAILARWNEDIDAWRRWRVDVADRDLSLARRLTEQALDGMAPSLPTGPRAATHGPVAPDLPWVLETDLGWADADTFAYVQRKKPARNQLARDATAVVLTALAHGGIDMVHVAAPSGIATQDLDAASATLLPRLRAFTEAVREGWFPTTKSTDVHLAADPTFEPEEHPL